VPSCCLLAAVLLPETRVVSADLRRATEAEASGAPSPDRTIPLMTPPLTAGL
jgi:hypothetical protein